MAEASTSQPTSVAPTGVSSQASEKSLKRKLEDALQTLDEAVGPTTPTLTRPPPPKRLRTAHSIYSTLTKYGIKKDSKPQPPSGDLESLSKTAPHLVAILSRTASRTRKALPFRHGQATKPTLSASPSASEYRPSSTESFLARLSTYKLSTYGNKPPAIDAVAAAKCGWVNDGKDRLVCGICGVSWVVASRNGMTREAANALVEKQRVQLVEAHKDGCPWKTRQCDDSIYHVPLQAPLATIRDIKSRAIVLDTVMQGVEIKHPLTAAQVQSILSIVSSVSLPSSTVLEEGEPSTPGRESTPTPPAARQEASETAVLTALFGWSILPPAPPTEPFKTPSVSRASSVVPPTPSRCPASRASSVARDSTPTPSTPRPPRPPLRMNSTASVTSQLSTGSTSRPDTTLLHCSLCQRRVGLWAFLPKPAEGDDPMTGSGTVEGNASGASKPQPQRQLDILREHRPYCPYVVRSTTVPSLPAPSPPVSSQQPGHSRTPSLASMASANGSSAQVNVQPSLMEGWRAVMTVVQRYGALQRQRLGLNRVPSGRIGEVAGAGVAEGGEAQPDPIEAMVAGVKSHGGRDLLRYVKGLLG
ncbi:zf-C3HC-domain-containing protein [Trametes sanguinea]|nr:zf-C3HC-domain-containing protein [Trametes sanguinea]